MTQNGVATKVPASMIGTPIPATTSHGVTVICTLWHRHANITVEVGTLRTEITEWSGNVSLADAQAEFRRVFDAFERFGTAAAIDTHAERLRRELDLLEKRPHGMRDNARIGAIYTELAQLEDLATARTRAAVANHLAAAA